MIVGADVVKEVLGASDRAAPRLHALLATGDELAGFASHHHSFPIVIGCIVKLGTLP